MGGRQDSDQGPVRSQTFTLGGGHFLHPQVPFIYLFVYLFCHLDFVPAACRYSQLGFLFVFPFKFQKQGERDREGQEAGGAPRRGGWACQPGSLCVAKPVLYQVSRLLTLGAIFLMMSESSRKTLRIPLQKQPPLRLCLTQNPVCVLISFSEGGGRAVCGGEASPGE